MVRTLARCLLYGVAQALRQIPGANTEEEIRNVHSEEVAFDQEVSRHESNRREEKPVHPAGSDARRDARRYARRNAGNTDGRTDDPTGIGTPFGGQENRKGLLRAGPFHRVANVTRTFVRTGRARIVQRMLPGCTDEQITWRSLMFLPRESRCYSMSQIQCNRGVAQFH